MWTLFARVRYTWDAIARVRVSKRGEAMRTHRQQGSVFLSSLMAISGLIALLALGTIRSTTELSVAQRFLAKQQAFALAEAATSKWLEE